MNTLFEMTQKLLSIGKDVRVSYSSNGSGGGYLSYVCIDGQFEFDLYGKSDDEINKIIDAVVYLYKQGVL